MTGKNGHIQAFETARDAFISIKLSGKEAWKNKSEFKVYATTLSKLKQDSLCTNCGLNHYSGVEMIRFHVTKKVFLLNHVRAESLIIDDWELGELNIQDFIRLRRCINN